MANKKYIATTTKHPTKNAFIAVKTGTIDLGGGHKMEVQKGDILHASDPYDGQAGRTILVAPQGNHSKFALSPETLSGFFKRVRPGTETFNRNVRDDRGTNPQVQTGGRRTPEEISGGDSEKSKNKKEQPMDLEAGDQYDLDNMDALIEHLAAYSHEQLVEIFESLSDQDLQMIDQYITEREHSEQDIERKYNIAMRVGATAPEGSARAKRAEHFQRTLLALKTDAAQKAKNKVHGERHQASTVVPNSTENLEIIKLAKTDPAAANARVNAAIGKAKREGHGAVGRGGLSRQESPGSAGKSVGASDETHAAIARGYEQGMANAGSEPESKTKRGGGVRKAVARAVTGYRLEKGVGTKLKSISSSYEPTEPQIMENYVQTAINGDVINFAETIRNSLDAHANAAVENIKNDMIDYVDQDAQEIEEQVSEFLEHVESLDDAQLDEYFESLDNEQLELVEELLDEAKYGTKKGRHRLAMKIRAGKDIGKKGKNFEMVARKAAKRYGSAKRGRAVAAAAMWKKYGGKRK
jgi:hypothetical protein